MEKQLNSIEDVEPIPEKYTSDHFDNGTMLLLFAMIRSVVKSFKVPDVEVVAVRMSNESALTLVLDG